MQDLKFSQRWWDITPYSPLKVNRRFGGTYRFHLQDRRISRLRKQRESMLQAVTTQRYIPEDTTVQEEGWVINCDVLCVDIETLRNQEFLRVLPNTPFYNGLQSDVSIMKGKVIKKAYGGVDMNLLLHLVSVV